MPSLYDLSVPVYITALQNLLTVLQKGEEWANQKKISPDTLVEARLIADMLPLKFQIQAASNTSKAVLTRLAGQDNVSMADDETTYAQLRERVEKTVQALQGARRENFEGKDDQKVTFKAGPHQLQFTGVTYLQRFGLPNFFFHVITAYDILRKEGVPVGKFDFLGSGMTA